MPLIESRYRSPRWLWNAHMQTIYPNIVRRERLPHYERERIPTPDGDVLDLDWARRGSKRLAVISHGLEGSTRRWYVLSMAKLLNEEDFDVLAWNFRGCSGQINTKPYYYHSGKSEDLETVVLHGLAKGYPEIVLVGFSVGGNITLKYLGEGRQVPAEVSRAVTFSVPCELGRCADVLAESRNRFYMKRFLVTLTDKILLKKEIFPELDITDIRKIRDFHEFDNRYTAPLNGFRDAQDYWLKNSSRQFLGNIKIPSLLVSAANDSFLSRECFPVREAEQNKNFYLEIAPSGGHMGFTQAGTKRSYAEQRAIEFLKA